jgi:hypothetical protein
MTGTKTFVRPNAYEPGRANIVVYNWDKLSSVAVDVRSVLPNGAPYEVRNAQDFFAAPVMSGTFDGQPLQLPMQGLSVAKPNGPFKTPAPTGPQFNTFVLLQRGQVTSAPPRLRISVASQRVTVSWPANAGNFVLQSSAMGTATQVWNNVTAAPTIVDGQNVVTEPVSQPRMLYRLKRL